MGEIFEIPLNDGQDESADRIYTPDGKLRLLSNARLSRDGRIEVRPFYRAQTMTDVFGQSLTAYDLHTFNDDLVAVGTIASSEPGPGRLFRLVSAAQGQWVTTEAGATGEFFYPIVSDIKTVWQSPFGAHLVNYDIAYTNGYLCAVFCSPAGTALPVGTLQIYILKASTGAVVFSDTTTFTSAKGGRVVASGNSFVLVYQTSGDVLRASVFATGSSTSWPASTSLSSNITADKCWDLCRVQGSTDYIVAYSNSSTGNLHTRRYNTSHVQQWENTQATIQAHMAVCCGTTHTTIAWVSSAATATVTARSLTTSAGANVSGATNIFTTSVNGQPRLAIAEVTGQTIHVAANGGAGASTAALDHDTLYSLRTTAAMAGSSATQENHRLHSKLYTYAAAGALTQGACGAIGGVFNGSTNTEPFLSSGILDVSQKRLWARWNVGFAGQQLEAVDSTTPVVGAASIATDGLGTYWGLVEVLDDSQIGGVTSGTLQIVEFKVCSTARRQSAEMQGGLYIAGGSLAYFDGRLPVEVGFLDTPAIINTVQGTAGSLTQLGTYNYVAVYEWFDSQGRVHRSPPSSPVQVVLTGANDDVTLTISTTRSRRRQTANLDKCKVVIYRTINNDGIFFRVGDFFTSYTLPFARALSFQDVISDTDLLERPVLYTQSQTPDAHFSPLPSQYVAAGKDRLILGGLPDPYLVQFSKLPFPNESIVFGSPNATKYQARINEPVTAVAAFGDRYLAFSADSIYEIPGVGPQRNGQGEFFYPRELYSDGGCIDWRSLCHCAKGLWFQETSNKLSLFNGEGVEWAGAPIRDTLSTYSEITGACLLSERQEVVFGLKVPGGSDGGLLIYDLRRGVWSFDFIGAVTALVEYDGRLAYLQGGVVYIQDTVVGAGLLPNYGFTTGSFRFFSAMGWGDLNKIGLLGTYLGDCTIEMQISYDDGKTFTLIDTHAVTAANGYAINDPVSIIFDPAQHRIDRFQIQVVVTGISATSGVRLHTLTFAVESEDFLTRRPARDLH